MTNPKEERRKSLPRNRVLLSGKLVFDNCARTVDCTIHNKTTKGAQVKLASAEPIPARVYLIDVKNGLAIDCHVSWVRPTELGLKFLKSFDLRPETNDGELKGLRRIWMGLAAR
jgi:hypothetical protein